MSSKHEVPTLESKLKTQGRFEVPPTAAKIALFGEDATGTVARCTITADIQDGDPTGYILLSVNGTHTRLNPIDSAAVIRGLVEHLSARGDLSVGRAVPEGDLDDEILGAIAVMIIRGQIPEDIESAQQ